MGRMLAVLAPVLAPSRPAAPPHAQAAPRRSSGLLPLPSVLRPLIGHVETHMQMQLVRDLFNRGVRLGPSLMLIAALALVFSPSPQVHAGMLIPVKVTITQVHELQCTDSEIPVTDQRGHPEEAGARSMTYA